MNYRERMRKAIECPQFGDSTYGEYGALRLDQRKNIKRLLDEMDRADEVIKHQYFELERYKNIVDKIQKLCDENTNGIDDDGYDDAYYDRVYVREIDEIIERELKGSDN